MSMLAERKIKQKWSLNPRGKDWSEDSNKFGQKMLEKMGWSKGKGLGARENGIKEHIKISYKNDSKGMGYKENTEQWTEHEDNFKTLLQTLSLENNNNTNGTPTPIENTEKLSSLEKKSQSSKVRVHYRKFTRGKDLSRYSEKDLANIFGKKNLTEPTVVKVEKEEQEESQPPQNQPTSNGMLYNAGSMHDYFKNKSKLAKIPKNDYMIGNNGVLQKVDDDDCPRLGFGSQINDEEMKSPRLGFGFSAHTAQMQINGEEMESPRFGFGFGVLTNGKKSKKRKSSDIPDIEVNQKKLKSCLDNPAFNQNDQIMNDNQVSSEFEVKRKKKKSKLNGDADSSGNLSQISNEFEVKRKKKKSKLDEVTNTASISEIDNLAFDTGNSADLSQISSEFEVKRKKKKSKLDEVTNTASISEIDNLAFDTGNSADLGQISSEFEAKRKKKKSKLNEVAKTVSVEIDNPAFDTSNSIDLSQISSEFEVKRKKKKSKLNGVGKIVGAEIDNPGFDTNNSVDLSQISSEFEVQRKKKKSKFHVIGKIEDNPAFNTSDSVDLSQISSEFEVKCKQKRNEEVHHSDISQLSIDISQVSNEYEVKRKKKNTTNDEVKLKKKQKKKYEIDNPSYNDSDINGSVESSNLSQNFEVVRKEKKKKKLKDLNFEVERPKPNDNEIDNLGFSATSDSPPSILKPVYEVPRKKKKSTAIDNPVFNDKEAELIEEQKKLDRIPEEPEINDIACDFMLNITSTPILKTPSSKATSSKAKRRKSVRFSNVNEEHIIPNLDDLNEERNELFDINSKVIDSNNRLETISRKIDGFQAEIENDLNEAKILGFIGDTTSLNDGRNHEKLADGQTKLKFHLAQFRKGTTPNWMKATTWAKKSYKHLIKGDIVVGFNNSNLHEIDGYAITKPS